jgi:hypothetical protein
LAKEIIIVTLETGGRTMRKLFIILLFSVLIPLAYADELKIKGYIRPDPVRGANHYLISNDRGNVKARIKPDPLWSPNSGRYLIIDKKGNESGRIRPDYINKDRYIIETVDDD